MKIFTSLALLSVLSGCSPEPVPTAVSQYKGPAKKNSPTLPDNPDNAYDSSGIIYGAMLDAHYLENTGPLSLQQAIEQGEDLAFADPAFQALEDQSPYVPITAAAVMPYLNTGGQGIRQLLAAGYSPSAKDAIESLSNTMATLKANDAPYEEVFEALVAYESAVKSSQTISAAERCPILTTMSILRNAMYHDTKRKRRDRDWEWMTGHCAAAANAALESPPRAIIMSFAIDAYMN